MSNFLRPPRTSARQASPSFIISLRLLKFMIIDWVGDAIQPSHPLSLPSLALTVFPSTRVFSNESVFTSGSQSTCQLHSYIYTLKVENRYSKYLYMDVCNSTIHKCANNEDICQTPNGHTKCSITPKEESSTFGIDRYTLLYLK